LFDKLINSFLDEKETRIAYEENKKQTKSGLPPILATPRALMNPTNIFDNIKSFENDNEESRENDVLLKDDEGS
jgi:hypothetical protein